nr:hypothetical protein [Bacilli bacterium]
MEETERIKIFGQSDCYGLSKDLSFTLRLTYEFKDEIVKEDIEEAVKDLEKRFSYLKVTLKKDFKEFYYLKNDKPFLIKETSRAIPLNGEDSNGHLIAFSYKGRRLFINAYHGQMDGTGIFRVSKALIYYYCLRRYSKELKVEDVAKVDEPIDEEEYLDAYKTFYEANKKTRFTKQKLQKPARNIMILTRQGKVKHGTRSGLKIVVPQKDLMAYCSSYDGSPVTALALIMAEAIRNVHPTSRRNVVVGIPVNLRPAMGLNKSNGNLFGRIHIDYSERLGEKDIEHQGTICRGTIIRYSDPDILRKSTYKYCKMLHRLNSIPVRGIKQMAARMVAGKMKR